MNQAIFLERLQFERDKFENLLNRLGFSRKLTMKGITGGLSIKDLLADTLSREQFIADRLSEILHNEVYTPSTSYTALENFQQTHGYPDYESPLLEIEKPQHSVIYKFRNIGLDEIVDQEIAAYLSIYDSFKQLTHNQCLDHDLFHRIAEHTYKPYRRAGLEINRWLKRTASESKP